MTDQRCQAMTHRVPGGHRCPRRAVDGKLCGQHVKYGALIPDEWTPGGLPVFYVAHLLASDPMCAADLGEAVTAARERVQS